MSLSRIYLGFKDNQRNKTLFILQDVGTNILKSICIYDNTLQAFHLVKSSYSYYPKPKELFIQCQDNPWGYRTITHDLERNIISYVHVGSNNKSTVNIPVTLDPKDREDLLKRYEKSLGVSRFTPALWKAKADAALKATADAKQARTRYFFEGEPVPEPKALETPKAPALGPQLSIVKKA